MILSGKLPCKPAPRSTSDLDTVIAALYGWERILNHCVARSDDRQRIPRSKKISTGSGVGSGEGPGTLPRRVELGARNRACQEGVEASLAISRRPVPTSAKYFCVYD